jgi:subtilisin-like proprotein convertase family protein
MKKVVAAMLLVAAFCVLTYAPRHTGAQGPDKFRRNERAIRGHYVVVLEDDVPASAVASAAVGLSMAHGGRLGFVYEHALRGFSVEMNEAAAQALSRRPHVAYVEEDMEVEGASIHTQTSAPAGLDRVDQRDLPLDTKYVYDHTGAGVNVYVIDSGIRTTHQEFGGRASVAYDGVGDGQNGQDCFGHGTHVAGIVGGSTYGVAKGASLKAVRVLNCSNTGALSQVIAGINWVTANHSGPSVATLAVSTTGNTTLDSAVSGLITSGVTAVVPAGNNNLSAGTRSPGRVPEAITVGAVDQFDTRATTSNFGSALDLFAPGVDIVSATWSSDTATETRSGTSQAAAFAAGVAARYLAGHTSETPAAVAEALAGGATPGRVQSAGTGSSNKLLYGGINGKIAYFAWHNDNSDIRVMNADGTGKVWLTDSPGDDEDPVWSPDGSKLAFHSYRDGNAEIYVMDADGTNQTRLTNNTTDDYDPHWSPDGTKLVFTAMRHGENNSEIYVMNSDGTNQTRLTNNSDYEYDYYPVWSPDGTKIAFGSSRTTYTYRYFTMNPDGTNQALFNLSELRGTYGITWAPDMSKLAFATYPASGNLDIYTANADATGEANLTNTSADSEYRPDWRPDGTGFVARGYDSANGSYVFTVKADGTGKTIIASGADAGDYPNWQHLVTPPSAMPVLALGTVTPSASGGDADAYIEPGEGGTLGVQISNGGDAAAKNITATLATTTPGVTVTTASSAYADLAPSAGGTNSTPFAFSLASTVACGEFVNFTLTLHYTRGSTQVDRVFSFGVQTGQPNANHTTISYAGPAVVIPDDDPAGVNIPVTVSGFTGKITDVDFSIDGTSCTTADGATTVGLDHTWVGDLTITLISPHGTAVLLYGGNQGDANNFCNTLYDDDAATPLQGPAPFTGTFFPIDLLSDFNGEDPNGTWILNVADYAGGDTGHVRAFSLHVAAFQCN